MAAFNFNANDVPADEGRELIPAGNYMVLIENSELTQTKAGNGTILKLTLNILDGAYQNRKIWWNINVQHTNSVAQEIGQRQLAQVCHAVGKITINDTSELHLIPFIARVVISKDKNGQYDDRNEVREAKPVNSAQPAAPASRPAYQQPAAQRPAPAAAAPATPPPAARPAGNTNKPAWVK